MSIHYAQLRKQSRRSNINETKERQFSNYHRLSQNKTFTESFPVSVNRQQTSKRHNQLSLLDFEDPTPLDMKNHPFTFQDKLDQKTAATKKRFVFDDQVQTTKSDFKNILAAMDEYIDYLNDSSDSYTLTTESGSKMETLIFQKFNLIRQKHQDLVKRHKETQHNFKSLKYEHHNLRKQLQEAQNRAEDEHNEKLRLAQQYARLKQKYRDLQTRSQFLQNSFLKERLKNENHKLMRGRVQENVERLETQSQQLTHETHESDETDKVTRFLRQQMRKLKHTQMDSYSGFHSKYPPERDDF